MTFSSSAAEVLQQNRLGLAARSALDEDSDAATAAAAAAAAAAAPAAGLPFGRKNVLGTVPGGLPPYLPEDVNACTLMPPWSLSLAENQGGGGGPPAGDEGPPGGPPGWARGGGPHAATSQGAPPGAPKPTNPQRTDEGRGP
ncbi:hypothetical protein Emed_006271 [Eimeria media]